MRAGAPSVFFLASLFFFKKKKSLQLTKTKIWVRLGESLIDPRPIPIIGQQPSHYCSRGHILLSSTLGRGSQLVKAVNLLALRDCRVHSKIKTLRICGNLLKNRIWKGGWKTEYFKTGHLQGHKTTGCSKRKWNILSPGSKQVTPLQKVTEMEEIHWVPPPQVDRSN